MPIIIGSALGNSYEHLLNGSLLGTGGIPSPQALLAPNFTAGLSAATAKQNKEKMAEHPLNLSKVVLAASH